MLFLSQGMMKDFDWLGKKKKKKPIRKVFPFNVFRLL